VHPNPVGGPEAVEAAAFLRLVLAEPATQLVTPFSRRCWVGHPVKERGERYVDLILPSTPTAARLTSGSIIQQDRSSDAIELDQVLGNLLPMLAATQPDKLSLTLTAIAQGL